MLAGDLFGEAKVSSCRLDALDLVEEEGAFVKGGAEKSETGGFDAAGDAGTEGL